MSQESNDTSLNTDASYQPGVPMNEVYALNSHEFEVLNATEKVVQFEELQAEEIDLKPWRLRFKGFNWKAGSSNMMLAQPVAATLVLSVLMYGTNAPWWAYLIAMLGLLLFIAWQRRSDGTRTEKS